MALLIVSYATIAIESVHSLTKNYHEKFLGCEETPSGLPQLCKLHYINEITFTRSTALHY
jgi:hypothetical protein